MDVIIIPSGTRGPDGAAGQDGLDGEQGPQGIQGLVGPQGDPGSTFPEAGVTESGHVYFLPVPTQWAIQDDRAVFYPDYDPPEQFAAWINIFTRSLIPAGDQ